MKNDKLLIAFNQKEGKSITCLPSQRFKPLDSGQLINIKGGAEIIGEDEIVMNIIATTDILML